MEKIEKNPKTTRVKKERSETTTIHNNKENRMSGNVDPNAVFYNKYATRKTFTNGLLNGALLATNAAQLRLLLADNFFNKNETNWFVSISLVASSLIGQVILLVLAGVLVNKNIADKSKIFYSNIINNIVLILSGILFCINIILNVFIQMETSNFTRITPTATEATNEELKRPKL